jgi:hypothetical protein
MSAARCDELTIREKRPPASFRTSPGPRDHWEG